MRAGGKRETARAGIFLYAGDTVVVPPAVKVDLQVGGDRMTIPRTRTRGTARYVVPARPGGFFSRLEDAYLSGWRWIFAADLPGPAVYTRVRNGDRPSASLRADPVLPAGPQRLPGGSRQAVAIWRGGAAIVELHAEGAVRPVNSEGFAFAEIPLAGAPGQVRISLRGQDLGWDVTVGGNAPPTPWAAPGAGQGLSDAQRTARASWLLREGPIEWRLFAVTEIRELAAAGDFPASALWAALISREPVDWASRP